MRKLILLAIISVTAAILMIAFSGGEMDEYMVHLKDGTSYEEAYTIGSLAIPGEYTYLNYGHQNPAFPNHTIGWGGSYIYKPNQNVDHFDHLRSRHWKDIYSRITSTLNELEQRNVQAQDGTSTIPLNPVMATYLESLHEEKAEFEATIMNCWDNHSCPSIPMTNIQMIPINSSALTDIQSLPFVESVELIYHSPHRSGSFPEQGG